MTYTKDIARHDKIVLDGVDASNMFRTFNPTDERSDEDATGFSVTGTRESLAGTREQSFEGEAFYGSEAYALLKPLYDNDDKFELQYQPNGLVDDTREVYYGIVRLRNWNPQATVGGVRTFTLNFVAADSTGIVSAAAT